MDKKVKSLPIPEPNTYLVEMFRYLIEMTVLEATEDKEKIPKIPELKQQRDISGLISTSNTEFICRYLAEIVAKEQMGTCLLNTESDGFFKHFKVEEKTTLILIGAICTWLKDEIKRNKEGNIFMTQQMTSPRFLFDLKKQVQLIFPLFPSPTYRFLMVHINLSSAFLEQLRLLLRELKQTLETLPAKKKFDFFSTNNSYTIALNTRPTQTITTITPFAVCLFYYFQWLIRFLYREKSLQDIFADLKPVDYANIRKKLEIFFRITCYVRLSKESLQGQSLQGQSLQGQGRKDVHVTKQEWRQNSLAFLKRVFAYDQDRTDKLFSRLVDEFI